MVLQTDAPLKLAIKPLGGIKMVKDALKSYGYKIDDKVDEIFSQYRKTQNEGIFNVYSDEMKLMRRHKLLTGMPDSYARGRIIPELSRVPLFGVDKLIKDKVADFHRSDSDLMTPELVQTREEISAQIKALQDLKVMAKSYGIDVGKPAQTAREALQNLYIAYLATIKESDGAAMSLGRVDAFLDVFIEKDIKAGLLTEETAQELIDDFVLKLRIVRHLRPPEYNELFTGNPVWATLTLGGLTDKGENLVTKTSFRFLQTLHNMNAAPEPNMTVLWSPHSPEGWKRFCIHTSIKTSSIQYESDALARKHFGDNASVACCVSLMDTSKQKQFFGARINLLKILLYAINGGVDEVSGVQVGPPDLFDFSELGQDDVPLDYENVLEAFRRYVSWAAEKYANAMNIIHTQHDKYNYEAVMHALHDTECGYLMAFGAAGISHVADSLSAIKHAKVYPVYNDKGIATDFRIVGDFPKYGNDLDAVDDIAKTVIGILQAELSKHALYRGATPTLSLLSITSNVVYGKVTGTSPDGRKRGQPFAPGGSPSYHSESSGAIASLNSVAKIPYELCLDGVSNTFCISPGTLGKDPETRMNNGITLLNSYMEKGGFHLNVNVFDRDLLLDAQKHPEKYPNLVIRVSGYAVNWHDLTKEQQADVLSRTVFMGM
jgi:formate C-acetyltransferase